MFKFFKEKIKNWLGKTKEEIEKQEKPAEKPGKKEEKKTKPKPKKLKEKPEKEEEKAVEEEKQEKEKIKALPVEKPVEEKSFFSKLLGRTITIKQGQFDSFFENLELILLENNVAVEAVDSIKTTLEKKLIGKEIKKSDFEEEVQKALKQAIEILLIEPFNLVEKIKEKQEKPFVILFFGINGSGKTTTIAKLASLLQKNNLSSVLAAADTFRAASIEQLEKHSQALGVKVISQSYGADPAAVAFDAIKHAKAHKIDAVLIDTAGRMHTKENLLNEMNKISRVAQPDLKIFIGESITGNDATEQAKSFNETIGIDAVVLSKADVDEKGGTAISVSYITGKPILYLGTGQNYADLQPFDKEKLIESLGL